MPKLRSLPRALLVIAVALLFAIAMALGLLHTRPVRNYALEYGKEYLRSETGFELQAEELNYNLFTGSFSLQPLRVQAAGDAGRVPLLEASRLEVDFSVVDLLFGVVRIETAVLQDGAVRYAVDEQGRGNLPPASPAADSAPSGPPLILVERLEAPGLAFSFHDEQLELRVDLPRQTLRVEGDATTYAHHVVLETESPGTVSFQQRTLPLETVSVDANVDQAGAEIADLQVRVGGFALSVSGTVDSLAAPVLNLTANTQVNAARAAVFAGLDQPISGALQANFTVRGATDDLAVAGRLQSSDFAYGRLQNITLDAEAAWKQASGQVTVEQATVRSPEGELQAQGSLALTDDAGPSEIAARFDRVNLERLTREFESPLRVASFASGTLAARWQGFDIADASGTAAVRLTASRREPAEDVLPVAGSIEALVEGNQTSLSISGLRALGVSAQGELNITGDNRLAGRIDGQVSDVQALATQAQAYLGNAEDGQPATQLAGSATFALNLAGTLDKPEASSSLQARNLALGDITGASADIEAEYRQDTVLIQDARLYWNNQTVTANGEIGLQGESPALQIQVRAEQVSLGEVVSVLGSQIPVEGMVDLSADVAGTVADPRGELRLAASGLKAYGEILGELTSQVTLAGDTVTLNEFRLDQPAPEGTQQKAGTIEGSGSFALSSQQYSLQLSGDGLRIDTLKLPGDVPVRGQLTLSAEGQGSVEEPHVKAAIGLEELTIDDRLIGAASADLLIEGQLASVRASVPRFNLSTTAESQLAAPYPTQIEIRADKTDLSTLEITGAGGQLLAGALSAVINASGPASQWQSATAQARITDLQLQIKNKILHNEGDLAVAYDNQTLTVETASLALEDSQLSVSGTLPLEETASPGALRLDGNLNLNTVSVFIPSEKPVGASGRLQISGSLAGHLQNFEPDIEATLQNAAFFTEDIVSPLLGMTGTVRVRQGAVDLEGFRAQWAGADISADGRVPLTLLTGSSSVAQAASDESARLNLDVQGLVVNSFSELPREMGGTVSLHAEVSAPRLDPRAVTANVSLTELRFNYEALEITQDVPSALSLQAGKLQIDQFALSGPNTQIQAQGGLDLSEPQTVDLRFEVNTDAGILALPADSVSAAGATRIDLSVAGTLQEPRISGTLDLQGGQFSMSTPGMQAQNLDVRIGVDSNRVTLEQFSGTLNGGSLSATGGLGYSGASIENVDLSVSANNVFLEFPEGLRTVSRADVTLRSQEDAIVIGGKVEIEEGAYTEPIAFDQFLLEYVRSSGGTEFVTDPDPLLSRVRYNLDVDTATPLIIDNNLAKMAAQLDLRLVGTYYRPGLLGRVTLEEGGELLLSENRYFIDRGTIDFLNEARIQPTLDIVARTQVRRKYDIQLQISGGGAEDISTTLTSPSHPDLGEPDLISLLVTGREREELHGEEINVAAEQSLSYLTGRIGGRIARGAQESLGLSEVRIEPTLIAAESNPGARLTLGQRITNDLELIYSMNLATSGEQIWIAQYDLTKRLMTQATKQDDNTYRFDLRHDMRFGGGPDTGRRVEKRELKPIGQVRFEGDFDLTEKELSEKLKVESGKPYDFFKVRSGVERLQKYYAERGYLEARVNVERSQTDETVDLKVQIERGPQVQFVFEGFDLPGGVRERVEKLWQDGIFDAQRASESTRAIREFLVKDSFLRPEITHAITTPSDQQKSVLFEIAPGPRYSNVTLEFEGNQFFADEELRKQIRDANLLQKVYTKPGEVADFLTELYRQQGYLDVKVDLPRYELSAGTQSGKTVLPIQEGSQYRIAELTFQGNEMLSSETLLGALGDPAQRPYQPRFLQDALIRIEERYWQEGYNDVVINFNVQKKENAADVLVAVRIDENEKGVIQQVEVEGTHVTSEELVRQQLGLSTGDTLNYEDVSKARRALYRTGAYSLVDVQSNPMDQILEPGQQPIRMQVKVREVKPFQLRYGLFFDTERGPGLIADFTNHNSLGNARVLGFRARYDADVHEARTYLSQPFLRAWPLKSTVTLFARRELQANFITDRTGVSLFQETRWKDKYIFSYGYRFESTRTFEKEPDPFLPFDVRLNIAPLTSTLSRETRDEILDATRGSFWSNALEYAPSVLGSDLRFAKYFGQFYKYIPLSKPTEIPYHGALRKSRFVYAGAVRLGLAKGLGNQVLIPSERFFAGGGTTIRGFERDTLGPVDFLGDPAGGDAVFILNNELRFPMFSIFDGVAFLDIGNVYERISDFDPFSVRKSGGFGLRVRTPYFLLRADYGIKLDRRDGESSGALFFSIGQAF